MKVLKVLVGVILIILAGVWLTLYTPVVTERVVAWKLQQSVKDLRLDRFQIEKQSFVFPNRFIFKDVSWDGTWAKERQVSGSIPFADVRFGEDQMFLNAGGATLRLDDVSVTGAELDLVTDSREEGPTRLKGSVVTGPVRSLSAAILEGISGSLSGDMKQFAVSHMVMRGYGGVIGGQVDITTDPLVYDANLQCAGIEAEALEKINATIFSLIDGQLNGTIRLAGEGRHVSALELDLFLISGGRVKASLLELLTVYVPVLNEVTGLPELVKSGKMFEAQQAALKLKTVEPGLLTGEIRIFSEQLFLNLTVPLNIKYDGTLSALLQEWFEYAHERASGSSR